MGMVDYVALNRILRNVAENMPNLTSALNSKPPKEELSAPSDFELVLQEDWHLWLLGQISEQTIAQIGYPIQVWNLAAKKNDYSETFRRPIYLHIFSDGGDLYPALAVYDIIKNSTVPVYTINEGLASSAAFLVYLAGSKRFANPHATFCVHKGYFGQEGSFDEVTSAINDFERKINLLYNIISSSTEYTEEEIRDNICSFQDWYINYEEAVEKKLITDY